MKVLDQSSIHVATSIYEIAWLSNQCQNQCGTERLGVALWLKPGRANL